MMYIAKLSRRLALLRGILVVAAATVACSDSESPLGPTRDDASATAAVLAADTEIGTRVETSTAVKVRARAAYKGKVLGTQPSGARGEVLGGPASSAGDLWFNIDFDSGADGWVEASRLQRLDTVSATAATVTLSPSLAVVAPGASLATQIDAVDGAGTAINGFGATYTISDTTIATVDTLGVIRGLADGKATLRATLDGLTASLPVQVTSTSLAVGATARAASALYLRAEATVNSEMIGNQPTGALGTVLRGPVVDSLGDGLTRWWVDFPSGTDGWAAEPYAVLAVPVDGPKAASVAIGPQPAVVAIGARLTTQVMVADSNGSVLTDRQVAYASTDTTIATVDTLGVVSGLVDGTVTLHVTVDGLTASLPVQVTSTALAVGATARAASELYLRAEATVSSEMIGNQPAGALGTVLRGPVVDSLGDGLIRWWVDFPSGTDGWAAEPYVVLGTATNSEPTAPTVAGVTVAPSAVSLLVGRTAQLDAVARDASGTELEGMTFTWTSRDASRVSVSSSGLVTAIAAGTVWVVASTAGVSDSAAVTVSSAPIARVGHYVAPTGSSANSGTMSSPWDLSTAFAGAGGRVAPGDTVWIRGGTYSGTFTSSVAGSSGNHVVFRAYPNERVTIAHAGSGLTTLQVRGAWTALWGIEVMNPDPVRSTSSTGSEQRANGIVNNASNTKYINVIVHDAGVGFYNYTQHTNVEVSGSVFYNNGWQGPDRGHGHALYLKSDVGPIIIRDNVMFNQFGYGVHVYTNAGSGKLNNIRIERNTAFNNGTLSTNSNSENILLGGADYSTGSSVVGNLTYFTPGRGGRNVRVGYSTVVNGSVTVADNLMVGGSPVFDLGYWSSATIHNNVLLGAAQVLRQNNSSASGISWSGNTHHRLPTATAWYHSGSWRTFSEWQLRSGLGLTDAITSLLPSLPRIDVRPNAYEPGRATITVFDWARSGTVVVPIPGVLAVGERYEVRSVQDLFGPPLVSGIFGGSVTLPMGAVTPAAPVGMSSSSVERTGAEFDSFIITRAP